MSEIINKLTEAFRMAYHNSYRRRPVVEDPVSEKYFTQQEFSYISAKITGRMGKGVTAYRQTNAMMNRTVCGKFLAEKAFCLKTLETAANIGAQQYIIINAGYDAFPYCQSSWALDMEIFELNPLDIAMDKQARLTRARVDVPVNVNYIYRDVIKPDWEKLLTIHPNFVENKISFVNLMGMADAGSDTLTQMLTTLGDILPPGSSVVFSCRKGDFAGAGMPCSMLERMAGDAGFLIYEQLEKADVEEQYFRMFNFINYKYPLQAPADRLYCLAVKKEHKQGI